MIFRSTRLGRFSIDSIDSIDQLRGLQGMPSFMLIRPAVWPQYTNVTDKTDRQDRTGQDNSPIAYIGRTVLQTVAQKLDPFIPHTYRTHSYYRIECIVKSRSLDRPSTRPTCLNRDALGHCTSATRMLDRCRPMSSLVRMGVDLC